MRILGTAIDILRKGRLSLRPVQVSRLEPPRTP